MNTYILEYDCTCNIVFGKSDRSVKSMWFCPEHYHFLRMNTAGIKND